MPPADSPGELPSPDAEPWLDRWSLSDPERLQLVRECAQRVDNGLAPLIAAELIHAVVAPSLVAIVRVHFVESAGPDEMEAFTLPRCAAAIEALAQDRHADAKGAA
jgi:hypothetical protein